MSSYCNDCAEHVVTLSSDFFLLARSKELSPGFDLPYVASINATHFCRFAMQSLKCVAIFITMHFNVTWCHSTNGWNLTGKLLHTFCHENRSLSESLPKCASRVCQICTKLKGTQNLPVIIDVSINRSTNCCLYWMILYLRYLQISINHSITIESSQLYLYCVEWIARNHVHTELTLTLLVI